MTEKGKRLFFSAAARAARKIRGFRALRLESAEPIYARTGEFGAKKRRIFRTWR
jgi:hypothetical protein